MVSAARAAPLVLTAIVALGCGEPGEPITAAMPATPLDRGAYEALLAKAAGAPVPAAALLERAVETGRRIEARMDRLAAELGSEEGWRTAFAPQLETAPASAPELLALYREELERAAAFVAERDLVTLPAAAPEVVVLENPSLRAHFPLGLYHGGRFAVTTAAGEGEGDDPAYLASHCRVCIPPLAVHEGYPGHHVAFAHMEAAAGGPPTVAELARYKPFVEGWGLYAELLMLEQGYYREPARELGAWRMILLRVLRAEVDGRLHDAGGEEPLAPAAAAALYRTRLLVNPAAAATELRVHIAKPTVKASYFVGLLQLLELRERALAAEPGLDLRSFHDRLLSTPAPVPRIARERFGLELGGAWGEVRIPEGPPR